ncbi:hypothetical protein, partial [Acetobacter fabarum]|uniref:hypothetical protein n=1 Tax=Acetobacter fabarum TaxID=483199 RepID=UPI0022326441
GSSNVGIEYLPFVIITESYSASVFICFEQAANRNGVLYSVDIFPFSASVHVWSGLSCTWRIAGAAHPCPKITRITLLIFCRQWSG